jgi:hypothetical protein
MMPAKVFISCGQASRKEVSMVDRISQWFKDEGYDPYAPRMFRQFPN